MPTKDFETMLYLFGSASRGTSFKVNEDVDVDKIFGLAQSQGIWQTVYLAIHHLEGAKKYSAVFLKDYQQNLMRNQFVLKTVKLLEENGIPCCFMKGMVVAKLYKEPLCRISGDTDILIDEADEKKSQKILSSLGYAVYERDKNDHHYIAMHSIGGMLEVHVKMYSDPTKDILFKNMLEYNEEKVNVEIEGQNIKTFGITDNAIYLTAHYIKHFISKGVGVRQLMDVLLYIEKFSEKIDWERYNKLFEELKYTKLIRTLFAMGNKYFGFSFENSDCDLLERVVEESERAGVFGGENQGLDKFYDAFTRCRTHMDDRKYKKYMYQKTNTTLIRKIFPTKTTMAKEGYKTDNAKLFVSYFQRFWRVAKQIILKKRSAKSIISYDVIYEDLNENIKTRMDLMRSLDII